MAKYCSKCGVQLKEDAKVCGKCGNKIGLTVYPLSLHKTGKVLGISLVIATILIIITIIIGVSVLGSTNTANKVFDIRLGWPFGWFQMSHLTENSTFTIGVFSWVNLIGNFIFYLVLCFVLAYVGEMFFACIKNKIK